MTAPLILEDLGGGSYRVTGGAAPHIVTIGPAGASCDCTDYAYRARACKHLRCAFDHLVRAPLAATTAAGPGLERDVPPPDPDDA